MISPRRKPLSQVFYEQKCAKLPQNFAQNIMQLQMQMQFQQTYSIDTVVKLNQLYRIAIEHYINQDPRKATHFQRKLTVLLTNPQTLDLMDRKTYEDKQKRQRNSQNYKQDQQKNQLMKVRSPPKIHSNLQSKVRKQINQFNSQSQILVKSIIQGNDKKFQRAHRFLENNLVDQQERLKKRLQLRSKSKKL